MVQLPGFAHPSYPNHVCKLHRSLYGLRQSPRAWFTTLRDSLLAQGFTELKADASLFIYHTSSDITLILVSVDDIIITGSNASMIQSIIGRLSNEFSLHDLGPLHFFLGIQCTQTSTDLHLSQSQYAYEILKHTKMTEANPCSTPMATSTKLVADPSSPFEDPSLFRSTVGALQYLTVTRPDLAYSMNKVSQFMSQPSISHWVTVKRILRYVKHTLHLGLTITKSSTFQLHGFSDSDWAESSMRWQHVGFVIGRMSIVLNTCDNPELVIQFQALSGDRLTEDIMSLPVPGLLAEPRDPTTTTSKETPSLLTRSTSSILLSPPADSDRNYSVNCSRELFGCTFETATAIYLQL
ncbi:PREDICTED: uncharacterized protein LOC109115220 [Nelumbo nucifera]|uniref:Uncharacterized protein LOC109115220 n=2 Tax=Nelumbo nucifera TaxID=4432 RepID=A0A1U8Q7G1_NELNU|nr:PREDICTED: uncharacterized protein LOC109115220 [Nelumbo nucifera]